MRNETVTQSRGQLSARTEFNSSELKIAQGCNYSLDDYKTRLNNNVLIIGGSGTGKTTTIAEPNLLQATGSYIISDPKGVLRKKHFAYLKKKGYNIVDIDFTHPDISARYNPAKHIKSTQDILKLAYMLVNEKASLGTHADPYWDNITTIYLSAIIAYMVETKYEPFNFGEILKLMREGERADDTDKSSKLADRFNRLRAQNPKSWACDQFENANAAPYKTYDTIRSTLAAKFAKFDTEELRMMLSDSDINFEEIGQRKTAVFVTVSDTDRTMDSLVNVFFTQAMQALCNYADNKCADFRLPVPVRFILDDFATNCHIDEFPRMISSIRSRGISVMLMIQSEAQLERGYGEDSKTIISNCDTYVYLGGNDVATARAVSARCDKPLRQILNMAVGDCWVFRRGEPPVFTKILPAPGLSPEKDL